MARRITAGIAGAPTVGALQVTPTAILTSGEDVNITISPTGNGIVSINSDTQINSQGDLRFADADSSNYVAFGGPANIPENIIWTLPNADGDEGQVLATDGSGELSWEDKTIDLVLTESSLTHYITANTSTSGETTDLSVVSSLSVQPSTGTLSFARGSVSNSLGVGTAPSGTEGEIRATNDVVAFFSDDRLKTKLGLIENALDKVDSINGFYYEPNDVAQELGYEVKKYVGVSAQELQEVLPEVVVPAPIDENYLTVKYEKVVPLLIEAIKELRKELNELKQR